MTAATTTFCVRGCGATFRFGTKEGRCPVCDSDDLKLLRRPKPTWLEKMERLADRGIDTWEEYRGEK